VSPITAISVYCAVFKQAIVFVQWILIETIRTVLIPKHNKIIWHSHVILNTKDDIGHCNVMKKRTLRGFGEAKGALGRKNPLI
jgi:hypothetical protein